MKADATGNFAGKHLVIFGCGYIGGEIARQAVARGLRVTALTRNMGKAADLRARGIITVEADLAGNTWQKEVGPADYALNCVSSGGGGAEAYRHSYLAGMQAVVAWAERRGAVDTLVYTSSTSVYPQGEGVRVDESSPATGRDERTAVLVETEALLRASTARHRVILRLAGIYGPGRTHLLQQVQAGVVSGTGTHHLNLIHRDDVCGAIWAVLGSRRAFWPRGFSMWQMTAPQREPRSRHGWRRNWACRRRALRASRRADGRRRRIASLTICG